jgi:hypothetical protein
LGKFWKLKKNTIFDFGKNVKQNKLHSYEKNFTVIVGLDWHDINA